MIVFWDTLYNESTFSYIFSRVNSWWTTQKKNETLAQDKLTEQLNVLNESIASLVDLEKKNRIYHGKESTFEIIDWRVRNNWEEDETA